MKTTQIWSLERQEGHPFSNGSESSAQPLPGDVFIATLVGARLHAGGRQWSHEGAAGNPQLLLKLLLSLQSPEREATLCYKVALGPSGRFVVAPRQ